MRLDQLYRGDKVNISIELSPPKTEEPEEGITQLFPTVGRLSQLNPVFFSMTYGAGGSTRDRTLDLCNWFKNDLGLETTCHLNVVGQSKDDVRANLKFLKEKGIYNILALRGDPPRDNPDNFLHPEGFQSSVELIEEAHQDPFFAIAVAGFPEKHPEAKDRASDIAYLKRKIEAGGSLIITQLFFDNAYFFEFMEHVRKAGIEVPVVPGIMPIISVKGLRKMVSLCQATIPPKVEKKLSQYEDDDEGVRDYGIDLATEMCQELIEGGVPGLHFYAFNQAHSVEEVVRNLK